MCLISAKNENKKSHASVPLRAKEKEKELWKKPCDVWSSQPWRWLYRCREDQLILFLLRLYQCSCTAFCSILTFCFSTTISLWRGSLPQGHPGQAPHLNVHSPVPQQQEGWVFMRNTQCLVSQAFMPPSKWDHVEVAFISDFCRTISRNYEDCMRRLLLQHSLPTNII
jgi:hypothetical protein